VGVTCLIMYGACFATKNVKKNLQSNMKTKENITKSMARISERSSERFASMQSMLLWRYSANEILGGSLLPDFMELTPISKVMIAPKELVIPDFKPYMIVAFNYEPAHHPCVIVKIPERYTTTQFYEKISLS